MIEINKGEWYDRQGKPITMLEWGRLLEDFDYRLVACDSVGPYRVSTIWIGLDHGLRHNSPGDQPLIFETMVFKGDDSDLECWRYPTEKEALRGHTAMVAKWELVTQSGTG